MAFIPTRHTHWKLPQGAGRVEEMEGFSPPDRRVAPPLGAERYDLLIHVDRVEDWSPRSPRSSHSAQSGLPSSDSDHDDELPQIFTDTWMMHVEDGQPKEPHRRVRRAPVVDTGCGGLPRGGPRRDHDDQGGGGRNSWKDTLLGRRHGSSSKAGDDGTTSNIRQRSRSPQHHRPASSKGSGRTGGHSAAPAYPGKKKKKDKLKLASQVHVPTPPPAARSAAPTSTDGNAVPDVVIEFFATTEQTLALPLAQSINDEAHLEAMVAASTASPLDFHDNDPGKGK